MTWKNIVAIGLALAFSMGLSFVPRVEAASEKEADEAKAFFGKLFGKRRPKKAASSTTKTRSRKPKKRRRRRGLLGALSRIDKALSERKTAADAAPSAGSTPSSAPAKKDALGGLGSFIGALQGKASEAKGSDGKLDSGLLKGLLKREATKALQRRTSGKGGVAALVSALGQGKGEGAQGESSDSILKALGKKMLRERKSALVRGLAGEEGVALLGQVEGLKAGGGEAGSDGAGLSLKSLGKRLLEQRKSQLLGAVGGKELQGLVEKVDELKGSGTGSGLAGVRQMALQRLTAGKGRALGFLGQAAALRAQEKSEGRKLSVKERIQALLKARREAPAAPGEGATTEGVVEAAAGTEGGYDDTGSGDADTTACEGEGGYDDTGSGDAGTTAYEGEGGYEEEGSASYEGEGGYEEEAAPSGDEGEGGYEEDGSASYEGEGGYED